MPMKEFIKKHPALADVCDVILSLLCGSFALLAFGMWAFLHTKTGTAMTAVGSNPVFAAGGWVLTDVTI